ncbi:MAG: kelch-like protein, partial [Actinomycetota bacterium]|nr:kelch-like protein [Actinomycetota bacterium]
ALTLSDGRVAVVGGGLGSVPLAATEVFDPASGTWSPSGGLQQPRRGHGLVRLHDDRLLVAGGIAGGELLRSAEVFDPSVGAWARAGDMTHPRLGHTMTVLPDGTVLVTGGTGETGTSSQGSQSVRPLAAAELFNPATGTWTPVGDLLVPRFEHTATRLPDGRVLIAGGIGSEGGAVAAVASAELYDPATRTFARTGQMTQPRSDHAAVILAGGRVLAVGGDGGESALSGGEIYDPARGAWSQTAPLRQPRRGHSATLLDDGSVLVAGGEFFSQGARTSLASAERFDPSRETWADAGAMSCPRSEHAAVVLPGGVVLVAAGDAAFPGQPPIAQSCVDLYTPGS